MTKSFVEPRTTGTRRPVRLLLLVLVLPAPIYSQIFSLGVKGGIPATNAFQDSPSGSYRRPYIIGPTGEIHLPFHLAFEVDALYRRSGISGTFITYQFGGPPFPPVEGSQATRINDWQVPFLAKWSPGAWRIRPFVDGGVTYRHISGQTITQFYSTTGTTIQSVSSSPTSSPNTVGATFGAGLTAKLPVIRISPEIRYTHWTSPAYVGDFVPGRMNANQVDLLVGFTF